MDRNTVVVDGTRSDAPANGGFGCDSAPSSQDFGPTDSHGDHVGRNGIDVVKADGVYVENLTVCNFLSSAGGENGNEIWWNGGDGSGHIGMGPLWGSYLTASSSYNYFTDPANHQSTTAPMGQYGIFTSNEKGPGSLEHTYASNMGDSSYYIGACADCNLVVDDAHAENSALGFSGTNAGGRLVLRNSEWDENKAGIAPNALNNDDWPSPPNGACPDGVAPMTNMPTCSVIVGNNVHDNNNYNAPSFGIAGAAPPGTGILLSGVQNYTVTGNKITNNDTWGVVVNDFPDTETPPQDAVAAGANCRGGTDLSNPVTPLCDYPAFGNHVIGNTFSNNGGSGNPANGDIAVAAAPHNPGNCFSGNTDTAGTLTSDPPLVETLMPDCTQPNGYVGPSLVGLLCASPGAVSIGGFVPTCPQTPVTNYPTPTTVVFKPIPHNLASMPDPCDGVPYNAWCPAPTSTVLPTTGGGAPTLTAQAAGLSLPNTAARDMSGTGALLAAGSLMLLAVGVTRRRRSA
jgi:hypothetical protein